MPKMHTPETELIILRGVRYNIKTALEMLDGNEVVSSAETVIAITNADDAVKFRIEEIESDQLLSKTQWPT